MKRGTAGERRLAYAGIALWAVWLALWVPIGVMYAYPANLFWLAILTGATIGGLREIKQWQAGQRYGRPRLLYAGKPIYPRLAWFASGAVPSGFIVGTIAAIASGQAMLEVLAHNTLPWIAYTAGGIAMQSLMVARANRRNDAVNTASMVPPPPFPPPPRYDPV